MQFDLSIQHRFPGLDLDVTLSGGPGVTALFGPSGAGKTTVLKAMAGLLRPNAGHIRLGDRVLFDDQTHLPAHNRQIGVVFQDGRLFPHLTVARNLRFAAKSGDANGISEERLMDLLDIRALLSRRPGTLSGGETQRVALARALLSHPQMLLMDEPLAALDAPRKEEILPYLERLTTETALPILYVTHDMSEIARLADHVALMQSGKILRQSAVFDVLSDPEAIPLVGVRAAGAVLQARIAEHEEDGLTRLTCSAGPLYLPGVRGEVGETVRVRILAQDVILARTRPEGLSARNILPCRIETLIPGHGPGTAVALRAGDDRLLSRITDRSRAELGLEPGQEVFAIIKASSVARTAIGT